MSFKSQNVSNKTHKAPYLWIWLWMFSCFPVGVPFTRLFALDRDDPTSPNAHLKYSLVNQIPNKHNTLLFQIDADTGAISTTPEGTTQNWTHTATDIDTHNLVCDCGSL